MVSFEKFVKSMTPSLLELKVTPSFCFPFKIPDDPTATIIYSNKQNDEIRNFSERLARHWVVNIGYG